MADAKLMIGSPKEPTRELPVCGEVSIGRARDNLICIEETTVSQYHAVIERRGADFWLIDLDSTNGTTLNSLPLTGEARLRHRDTISISDVAVIGFYLMDEEPAPESQPLHAPESSRSPADDAADSLAAPQEAGPSPSSPALLFAAAIAGVLLAGAAAFLAISLSAGAGDSVRILSPETGSTIRGAQTIRIAAEEPEKIDEVIYLLDGIEFASADFPPFEVTLDPAQLEKKVRNLSSGRHVLTLTVQDKAGKQEPQPDTILLAFEMNEAPVEEAKKPAGETSGEAGRLPVSESTRSGSPDVAAFSRNLAATISGKSFYNFDGEFADEISRRTASYRLNIIDEASRYRRQIGSAFSSKGLPAALGFVMAVSESRFRADGAASAAGKDFRIGFWQVPGQVALEQGYITADEPAASLNDPKRAAEVAAAYINDLINAFGGTDHFMYAVACYGLPLNQAARVRARLEEVDPEATERKDFWKMVRRGVVPREGAERVARFFAAGIVSENPQAFGLNNRALSSLY
jgi:pSer/pThr/pTyr-binding forkhead associated (FHA) protein/soluble lytic murein transglycosylase-like protein